MLASPPSTFMTAPALAILPISSALPPASLTAAGALETDRSDAQGRDDFISGRLGKGRLELAVARLRAERFRTGLSKPVVDKEPDGLKKRWAFYGRRAPTVTPADALVGEIVVATSRPPIASEHQEVAELACTLAGAMEILADAADGARRGPIASFHKKPISAAAIDHLLKEVLAKIEKLSFDRGSSQAFQQAFFENEWARGNVPRHFEEATFRLGVINFAKVLILFNTLHQSDSDFAGQLYHLLFTPSLRTFFTNIADILVAYNRIVDQTLAQNTKEALEQAAKLGTAVEAIEEMLRLAQKLVPAELTLFWVQAMGERFGSQPTLKIIRELFRKIHVAQIRLNQ